MKKTLVIKQGKSVLDVKEAVEITLSFAKEVSVDASVEYGVDGTAVFTVDVVDLNSHALLLAMYTAATKFNMDVEVEA